MFCHFMVYATDFTMNLIMPSRLKSVIKHRANEYTNCGNFLFGYYSAQDLLLQEYNKYFECVADIPRL